MIITNFYDKTYKKYNIPFLNALVRVFGINEEIVELRPTEFTDLVLGERRADVVAITKSGRDLNIELETNKPTEATYKKCLDYAYRYYQKTGKKLYTYILCMADVEEGIVELDFAGFDSTFQVCQKSWKNIEIYDKINIIETKIRNNECLDEDDILALEIGTFTKHDNECHIMLERLVDLTNKAKCFN